MSTGTGPIIRRRVHARGDEAPAERPQPPQSGTETAADPEKTAGGEKTPGGERTAGGGRKAGSVMLMATLGVLAGVVVGVAFLLLPRWLPDRPPDDPPGGGATIDEDQVVRLLYAAAAEWRSAEKAVAEIVANRRDLGFFAENGMPDAQRAAEEAIESEQSRVDQYRRLACRHLADLARLAVDATAIEQVRTIVTEQRAKAHQKGWQDREQTASAALDILDRLGEDRRGIDGVVARRVEASFPSETG